MDAWGKAIWDRLDEVSRSTVLRFALRLSVLLLISAIAEDPDHTLSFLLFVSAAFCGMIALRLGEPINGWSLNRWDEAAVLLGLGYVETRFLW